VRGGNDGGLGPFETLERSIKLSVGWTAGEARR
jgi:hypothetical protein